jgi:hypothetical protein
MKNLLIIIAVCLSTTLYAQLEHMNISNIITFEANDYVSESTTITVPEGHWWVLSTSAYTTAFTSFNAKFDGFSDFKSFPFYKTYSSSYGQLDRYLFLTEGTEIYFEPPNASTYIVQIWEYDAPNTQTGTLTYDEIEDILNKGIKLFPNPTNSEVALNSEKQYEIKVYDLNGRKVMETTGNSLDMSILTNATYIVKAFDKESKETNSYKVVKN